MDYGFLTLILVACIAPQGISGAYHGKTIGPVTTLAHSFSGNVFAASDNSIVITNLNYDGNGPAAYFWGSFGPELDDKGEQLPDENGSMNVLKGYHNAQVLLKLPKKITEYKSIGMYCKKFAADFGHVKIPADYELPKQQSLGKLYPKQQSTMAAEVILKDSATMMLRQFEYGGNCPGSAFFVAGPSANPPVEQLTHLMYDDGKTGKLERYDRKDVMVKLPLGHHWNEYRWFSVYCMDTKQSYADIGIDMAMAEKLPLYDPSSAGPPSSSGSLLGPLSALSTLSMSVAMLLAAIVLLR